MYKLTDRMLQHLEKELQKFHELFQGGRCQAWQMEELIAKAIRSDFTKNEKVLWKGNGHDIGCDILINDTKELQIKSGVIKDNNLILSGHRLGRFAANMQDITDFLNTNKYWSIAVPYHTKDDSMGRSHIYQLVYFENKILGLDDVSKWELRNKNYYATNNYGVELSIRPSMSWQIWWKIPINNLSAESKTRQLIIK